MKTEWSLTGGGRLQESNHKGASSEKSSRSRHIYFMEDNLLHAMSVSYDMCSSMFSQKFFVHSK